MSVRNSGTATAVLSLCGHDGATVQDSKFHDGATVQDSKFHDGATVQDSKFHDGATVQDSKFRVEAIPILYFIKSANSSKSGCRYAKVRAC